jgi:hypothetical protein
MGQSDFAGKGWETSELEWIKTPKLDTTNENNGNWPNKLYIAHLQTGMNQQVTTQNGLFVDSVY